MSADLTLYLAINRLSQLKALEKTLLADVVDSERFYLSMTVATLSAIIGRQLRADSLLLLPSLRAAERDLMFCRERRVSVLPVWDRRYPAALREIYDPPFLLFVRGTLPDPAKPAIAVVGTREPGAAAVYAAERLGHDIGRAGIPVISGLARGIDAASHRGALRSGVAGATGAILGCGIDRICPASNKVVAARLLDSGGFVASEYSPGVPSAKYHFPARNRIISGMSRGVVVVQAPARSGALITAEYALDQGRDLFVHSEGLSGAVGAGTRELADDGARIVSSASDIFAEWGVVAAGVDPTPGAAHAEQSGRGRDAGASLASQVRAMLVTEEPDG
jgi:DNA processing protein